uniref:Protein disulfide isomerase like, testis expressed n=1 Tax=Chelonoidis abingdonii TaxID=106734 RepID=A0A8C0G1B5_CHEAB
MAHHTISIPRCGPWAKKFILAEEFAKAARQLKKEAPGIRFGKVDITDQKDLKKEFNIQEFPTVKFFVDGDRKNPIDCKGKLLFGLMESWISSMLLFFPFQIMFILVDTNETRNGRIFEYFRITEVDVPAVRILNLTSDAKYKMPADEVTVENLRSFCHSYLGGKAKPHVSSEEIPEDWDKNPVKVLVGKNFNRVTFNKTKNVFVMFYAPWSHDCRKLLPIWDELGKKYEHHGNIVIAKIDFTANDIQLVMLDRHPFFRFFPVGSNNQVRSIPCVYVENASSGSKKFNSMILL